MTGDAGSGAGGIQNEGLPSGGELLTLKHIALLIGVPESTVRKYRDLFSAHVPGVGTGRQRLYTKEALEVFEKIRTLRETQRRSWDEIKERLGVPPPPAAAPAEERRGEPVRGGRAFDEIAEKLEETSAAVGVLARRLDTAVAAFAALPQSGPGAGRKEKKELLNVVQTLTFSIYEVIKKHHEVTNVHLLTLLDKVSALQGAVAYHLRQHKTSRTGASGAAGSQPPAKSDPETLRARLMEFEKRVRFLEEENARLKRSLEESAGGRKRSSRTPLLGGWKKKDKTVE
ncbi:MAG: MerR family transcriptional regulator [bacterium]